MYNKTTVTLRLESNVLNKKKSSNLHHLFAQPNSKGHLCSWINRMLLLIQVLGCKIIMYLLLTSTICLKVIAQQVMD